METEKDLNDIDLDLVTNVVDNDVTRVDLVEAVLSVRNRVRQARDRNLRDQTLRSLRLQQVAGDDLKAVSKELRDYDNDRSISALRRSEQRRTTRGARWPITPAGDGSETKPRRKKGGRQTKPMPDLASPPPTTHTSWWIDASHGKFRENTERLSRTPIPSDARPHSWSSRETKPAIRVAKPKPKPEPFDCMPVAK